MKAKPSSLLRTKIDNATSRTIQAPTPGPILGRTPPTDTTTPARAAASSRSPRLLGIAGLQAARSCKQV